MFDLDKAIHSYLEQLNDKRSVSRDSLEEIEGHLRDGIDFYLSEGEPPDMAFRKAIANIGSAADLSREYQTLFEGNTRAQMTNLLSHYFDRRVVMRLLTGFGLGAFFMLAGLLLEGGTIHDKIQPTAFIIVVGAALGALLITYPIKTVWNSFLLALTGRQATRSAYLDALAVFKSFGDFAVLASFVWVIFGTIHVLQHLTTPDKIGAGCAVALVALLYGVLLKLFIGKALSDSFRARAFPSGDTFKNDENQSGGFSTA